MSGQGGKQTFAHDAAEVAILGAGCYWTLDALFRRVKGVQAVEAGFAGGHESHPSYKKVRARHPMPSCQAVPKITVPVV